MTPLEAIRMANWPAYLLTDVELAAVASLSDLSEWQMKPKRAEVKRRRRIATEAEAARRKLAVIGARVAPMS